MIGAGARNKLMTIERLTENPEIGGVIENRPIEVTKVWASIEPIGGREEWVARMQYPTLSHRITFVYTPGINAKMRAKYFDHAENRERIFNFLTVFNVNEDHREIVVMATEVVD